jgi:hypothetical protein
MTLQESALDLDVCSLSCRVYDKERGSDVLLEIACPHSFPSSYHAAQSMRRYASCLREMPRDGGESRE